MQQNYTRSINTQNFMDFTLDERMHVSIVVRDISGQIVSNLVDHELDAGEHEVYWQPIDDQGDPLESGIYAFTMKTKEFTATKYLSVID